MKKQRLTIILTEVIILLLILTVELTVFMSTKSVNFASDPISITENAENMTVVGYDVSGITYTPDSRDPHIIFSDLDKNVRSVYITFFNRVYSSPEYKIYYSENDHFNKTNLVKGTLSFASRTLLVNLPEGEYNNLRIDIDGKFSISDIVVSEAVATTQRSISRSFNIDRVLILLLISVVGTFSFLHWKRASKNEKRLCGYELAFCAVCFGFYLLWAVSQGAGFADETNFYNVTHYIYANDRLPINSSLLSSFGYTDAHFPTILPNQLGYLFLKLTSAFSYDGRMLLLAVRMVSVVSATFAVYFVIKLSKMFFKSPARWIMITVFAFMPQFAHLASYANSLIVAVLGVAMLIYAWASGIKYGWQIKNCLLLCVGTAVCALSSYYSLAWILASVPMFILSHYYKRKKDPNAFLSHGIFSVLLTVLLVAYNFTNHLVVYKNLFGFKTALHFNELFAKTNMPLSFSKQGASFFEMLFSRKWLSATARGFIGIFGKDNVNCPAIIYKLAILFFIIGFIGFAIWVIKGLKNRKNIKKSIKLFYITVFCAGALTAIAFVLCSYFSPFVTTPACLYPAFIALALFTAKGYNTILQVFKKKEYRYAAISTLCTAFIGVSLYCFYFVYLPA